MYRGESLVTRALLILGAVFALIVVAGLVLAWVPNFFVFLLGMCAAATVGTLLIWQLLD